MRDHGRGQPPKSGRAENDAARRDCGSTMSDIFTTPLDQLSWQELADFLGLDRPPETRPAEADRLDYKESFTEKVSSVVAAMANGSGGVIMIGVAESDKTGPSFPAGLKGSGPAKRPEDQVANSVKLKVDPIPNFEVRTFQHVHGDSSDAITIVRVDPGDDPPYLCDDKIPIRVNATTKNANRRALEQLFQRRAAALKRPQEALRSPGADTVRRLFNPNPGQPLGDYLRAVAAPLHALRVRTDRAFEAALARLLGPRMFPFSGPVAVAGRDAEGVVMREQAGKAAWYATSFGRVEMSVATTAHAFHTGDQTSPARGVLGGLIHDLDGFLLVVHELWRLSDYRGPAAVQVELAERAVCYHPYFICGDQVTGLVAGAVPEVGNCTSTRAPSTVTLRASELAATARRAEIITDVLCDQLRASQGASVDHAALLAQVRAQLGAPSEQQSQP